MTVLRDGRRQDIPVMVGEKPEDPDRFVAFVEAEKNLIPRLGILAVELDDEILKLLPKLRGDEGVLVAARGSGEAGEEDTAPGGRDLLGQRRVHPLAGRAPAVVDKAKRGDALAIQVERKGQLLFLAQEVE